MSFNKIFVICLAVWGMMLTAQAQPRVPRHLDLAVVGGATLSQYNFDPTISQDMAKGYTFGVAARYIEEKYFGLQAEVLLTRRGYRDRYERFPEYSFQRDLTYLEIPVLAHIYFNLGKRSEIAVDLGPKFGMFLWDKKSETLPQDFGQEGSETAFYTTDHHTMSVHNNFDYGIQAGLGYEFKVTPQLSLQLSGRYYFGLGNIFPDEKSDVFETSSNQQVQIVLAVWWKHMIGKRRK